MAWVMPVIGGLQFVMEGVTFIQFIEEEAIQSASLGCFLALRARCYSAAARCITVIRAELVPHLKLINDNLGYLAPYSKGAFADFIKATELNLTVYDDLLYKAAKL